MDHESETLKHPSPKKEVCGDFCLVDAMEEYKKALFVVCDGLSGHMDSFASKYAAQKLDERIRRRFFNKDQTPLQEIIKIEIDKIDQELKAEHAGTTLEFALLDQETRILHTAHTGDSRIYLIEGGMQEKPFVDSELILRTIDQAHGDADRGPSNCLGEGAPTNVLYDRFDLNQMDETVFILMCTDGLTAHKVTHRELEKTFQDYSMNQELNIITDRYKHLTRYPFDMIVQGLEDGGITKGYWRKILAHFEERGHPLNNEDYNMRRELIAPLIHEDNPDKLIYRALFADAYATAIRGVHDDTTFLVADLKGSRHYFTQQQEEILETRSAEQEVAHQQELQRIKTRGKSAGKRKDERIGTLNEELRRTKADLRAKETEFSSASETISGLETQVKDITGERDTLTEERDTLTGERDTLQTQYEEEQRLKTTAEGERDEERRIKEEKNGLLGGIIKLLDIPDAMLETVQEYVTAVKADRKTLGELGEEKANLEATIETMTQEVKDEKERRDVSDEKREKAYTAQIGQLTTKLRAIVTEYNRVVGMYKELQEQQKTMIPVTEVEEMFGVVTNTLQESIERFIDSYKVEAEKETGKRIEQEAGIEEYDAEAIIADAIKDYDPGERGVETSDDGTPRRGTGYQQKTKTRRSDSPDKGITDVADLDIEYLPESKVPNPAKKDITSEQNTTELSGKGAASVALPKPEMVVEVDPADVNWAREGEKENLEEATVDTLVETLNSRDGGSKKQKVTEPQIPKVDPPKTDATSVTAGELATRNGGMIGQDKTPPPLPPTAPEPAKERTLSSLKEFIDYYKSKEETKDIPHDKIKRAIVTAHLLHFASYHKRFSYDKPDKELRTSLGKLHKRQNSRIYNFFIGRDIMEEKSKEKKTISKSENNVCLSYITDMNNARQTDYGFSRLQEIIGKNRTRSSELSEELNAPYHQEIHAYANAILISKKNKKKGRWGKKILWGTVALLAIAAGGYGVHYAINHETVVGSDPTAQSEKTDLFNDKYQKGNQKLDEEEKKLEEKEKKEEAAKKEAKEKADKDVEKVIEEEKVKEAELLKAKEAKAEKAALAKTKRLEAQKEKERLEKEKKTAIKVKLASEKAALAAKKKTDKAAVAAAKAKSKKKAAKKIEDSKVVKTSDEPSAEYKKQMTDAYKNGIQSSGEQAGGLETAVETAKPAEVKNDDPYLIALTAAINGTGTKYTTYAQITTISNQAKLKVVKATKYLKSQGYKIIPDGKTFYAEKSGQKVTFKDSGENVVVNGILKGNVEGNYAAYIGDNRLTKVLGGIFYLKKTSGNLWKLICKKNKETSCKDTLEAYDLTEDNLDYTIKLAIKNQEANCTEVFKTGYIPVSESDICSKYDKTLGDNIRAGVAVATRLIQIVKGN
ncbi:hypothetical protein HN695_07885 [Candidatus Woesearchaeota archaeon]|jgi:serine/threonine protein phosphatase PrpC|nr:hypothetical protein [Candidatus Woesearchaeota archaeon]MBT5272461.1 hypothetical protein [Candidatus Woesearchaeota archaeon]MBT6041531.1 hypothetical protein [Candidatus Woesearchaeota archaeon]MBT6336323.1 hypothetical protein [Candidatus Woesearchaeota archaeon]MBT7928225.1 hypothetical protein [Candidatus Woesearchaeota archaeon]